MSGLDLLAFTPAILFLVAAWIVAWRVSKTGNSAPRDVAQKPEATAHGNALAGR